MSEQPVKNDTTLTLSWLRVNVPSIAAIVVVGMAIAAWQAGTNSAIAQNDKDLTELRLKLTALENVPYRMEQVERGVSSTNSKVDGLSAAIARLATGIEVLSVRVGTLTGDSRPLPRATRPAQTPQ